MVQNQDMAFVNKSKFGKAGVVFCDSMDSFFAAVYNRRYDMGNLLVGGMEGFSVTLAITNTSK